MTWETSPWIKTRWLVVLTIAVVGVIGGLVYRDETQRSEAALEDLGDAQTVVARSAALVIASRGEPGIRDLAVLERPGSVILVIRSGAELRTLDGRVLIVPQLAAAFVREDGIVRIEPGDAGALGLPERTAMAGVAHLPDGQAVVVASSAERQRDRDRSGRTRVLLSMLLAACVTSAFAWIVWRKQRSEAELARELAVAEVARSRDIELDRLGRAATMAVLGSGVAHELSTPLGVIVGRAEQLMARAQGDERSIKNAQTILDQAEHINQIVRGLLGLARGAPIALQPVEARALVRDAAALVEHRFSRANVQLMPVVGATLPIVRCEPLLFKHALVNLLLNACDASPPHSTVRIDVHADAKEIAFIVSDDGGGITAEHAERALEPFFTTKPEGQGTGLGLAIANEIAKTHRGSLSIGPISPRGTRACIRIPIKASPT